MKKKTPYMLLLLVTLSMLLSACASVPVAAPEMDIKTKNMTPPPDKALLYVYRDAVFASASNLFEISIDGHSVGKLAEKTYLAVMLEPGKHRITRETSTRHILPINVGAGKTYYAKISALPLTLSIVSENSARKEMADYKLIYESEEPTQIVSAKAKPTNVAAISSNDPMPVPAIKVKSDVDELPTIKVKNNKNAYAIVIGIESYRQKLPKADYAVADAKIISEYLTKTMGYPEENVITLLNDRALKSDMEKYFDRWLANNVEDNGRVFIYYSGHGAPNAKTGDAYLVPYDGDPTFIAETGYSIARLYESLGKLKAREITVILDSCFSGAGGRSVLAKGVKPLVVMINTPNIQKNISVMSASSGDQVSSAYEEKGHGLFTYYLLKGIKYEDVVRPDGSIKMDDLFGYIKPQVERIARKQFNNEQTPQLIGAKKN